MASNLLVTIPVITVRAFRHCLFCSLIVSDRPNSSLSTKMGPLSINPFRLSPTFPRLSLFLSVWIMRSYLAWTGPRRLFLQTPFRFVSPQCNSPWVNLASWSSGLRLAHNGWPESTHKNEWKIPLFLNPGTHTHGHPYGQHRPG